MASVSVTAGSGDAQIQAGDKAVIAGLGFGSGATVTITVPQHGLTEQVTADTGGSFSSDAYAARAGATLTVTGQPLNTETVVVNGVTYTFKTTITAAAGDVLIGADAATSLANLRAAVNGDAGSGTLYSAATTPHATVGAGNITATTLTFYAKTGGTGGNAFGSTETLTNGSFGGATFSGGAAAGSTNAFEFRPQDASAFDVRCVDSNNTVQQHVTVFTE